MIAFTPSGPILTFTAATSAPTSVQATSRDGTATQQICLTNTDATNDAVIGWGASDAAAKLNAVVGANQRQYYLLHGTQVVITIGVGQYITGITAANTAAIKVQTGMGN